MISLYIKKLSIFFIKLFQKMKRRTGVRHKKAMYDHYNSINSVNAQSQLRILENQITQEKCALYAKGAGPDKLTTYENSATNRRMEIRKKNNYWTPHQ